MSVGVLSLTDAGWAVRLKAEGYYADLRTYVQGGGSTPAGSLTAVVARVANEGPADVDAYTLVVNSEFGMAVEDPDCILLSPGLVRCEIDQPLPAGSLASRSVPLRSSYVTTGIAAVGVLITSDKLDPVPENNFDATAYEILRRYDVRIELEPGSFVQGAYGGFARFRVHNDGPSVAERVDFDSALLGQAQGEPQIACVDGYEGICGIGFDHALLFPDGWVDLEVSLPAATPEYAFRLYAMTDVVEDPMQHNNVVTLSIATPIFASGFE